MTVGTCSVKGASGGSGFVGGAGRRASRAENGPVGWSGPTDGGTGGRDWFCAVISERSGRGGSEAGVWLGSWAKSFRAISPVLTPTISRSGSVRAAGSGPRRKLGRSISPVRVGSSTWGRPTPAVEVSDRPPSGRMVATVRSRAKGGGTASIPARLRALRAHEGTLIGVSSGGSKVVAGPGSVSRSSTRRAASRSIDANPRFSAVTNDAGGRGISSTRKGEISTVSARTRFKAGGTGLSLVSSSRSSVGSPGGSETRSGAFAGGGIGRVGTRPTASTMSRTLLL